MVGEALDNTTDVETPERIRFRYRLAGPTRRAMACLIDAVVQLLILLLLGLLAAAGGMATGTLTGVSHGVLALGMFLLDWGYKLFSEALTNGRTIGKRAMGLRVVKEGGYPVGFIDCLLRNLLRAADFLPFLYLTGLVSMGGDRRFRRLGDRVAGTMVVIEEPAAVATPLMLSPPPTAAELAELPHRPALSTDELEAIELFLRRAALSQPRREELAQTVAPVFARRMNLAPGDPVRLLGLLHARAQGARRAGTRAA